EKMKKLIEQLDTQTPQVMIEAKVVEATEKFGKNLSAQLGISHTPTSDRAWGQGYVSSGGMNPIDSLLGTPGVITGTGAGAMSSGGGSIGLTPNLGFLASNLRLNAIINMNEN